VAKKKSSQASEKYQSEGRLEANKKRKAAREEMKQKRKAEKLERRLIAGKSVPDSYYP
jgi:transcription elongation GreA/GreB family factor